MTLPITALTAAICAIMLLITAIDTVRQRWKSRVAFGDGGHANVVSASRSHGNLAEHAPLAVIMIGITIVAAVLYELRRRRIERLLAQGAAE